MIRLERIRTSHAIPIAFRGVKRLKQMRKLLTDKDSSARFQSDYWKKAKPQLKRESHGKCAYCEALTATVAHGDVEHFRPKSRYWWLAYCYDNYLYACQICNETYKGDTFPIRGVPLPEPNLPDPATEEESLLAILMQWAPDPLQPVDGLDWGLFAANCEAEQADLLNPYADDPVSCFAWEADPVLQEVSVRPRSEEVKVLYQWQAAVDWYGLNREELRLRRWTSYDLLETLVAAWQSQKLPPDIQQKVEYQLRYLVSAQAEYAGMNRYFVRQVWKLDW